MTVAYKLTQGSGTLVTQTLTEAVATTTSFDTVNVYMASATLTGAAAAHLTLQQVDITLSNPSLIVAPTITTPPADQTVIAGSGASFTVVATGTPTPTYQWQKNTVDIPGATAATLALTNVQPTNAGSYRVVVSNPGGTINSSPATLTVQTPPVIATPPASQSVLVGDNVSFAVLATGTSPFTYQWSLIDIPLTNGPGISGATSSNLVLTGVQYSQHGYYRVAVSNTASTSVSYSYPAVLTVLCGFTISSNSASFGPQSATGLVALQAATTDCPWAIVNTNAWVTILSSINNHGGGTVAYAVAANPGGVKLGPVSDYH